MLHRYVQQHIFYLALLSFGINLCTSFQLTNLSSMFTFLGASNEMIPLFWLVPPITGLIVQPLIGQISDDTISRYGKRRPYIVVWGILASLGFLILPLTNSLIYASLLIWVINCSLNGNTEALRALTGDLTYNREERSKALAIQAFFGGIGGSIGTGLPWLLDKINHYFSFATKINANELPFNLKVALVVASAIMIITTYVSMNKVKERPYTRDALLKKKKKKISPWDRIRKTFHDLYVSLKKMPKAFRQICFINGTTWLGIFIFWSYYTIAIAQNVYGLPIEASAADSSHAARLLQKAALDTSIYSTVYQFVSIAFALILYFLANTSRTKLIHVACLVLGGLSLALAGIQKDTNSLTLCFVGIGIMWGSMGVLPYAIAMQVLPKGKLGTYLGIFNISITMPQIVCALFLAPLYKYIFVGHAGYLLVTGGLCIILSGVLWFKHDKADQKTTIAAERERNNRVIAVEPT